MRKHFLEDMWFGSDRLFSGFEFTSILNEHQSVFCILFAKLGPTARDPSLVYSNERWTKVNSE